MRTASSRSRCRRRLRCPGPISSASSRSRTRSIPRTSISSVVYNPPGGAHGLASPPVVETLTDLSLTPADPNFVVTQDEHALAVHHRCRLPPPGPAPAGFPAAPTMLVDWRHDRPERHRRQHLSDRCSRRAPRPGRRRSACSRRTTSADPRSSTCSSSMRPLSGGVGVPTPVVVEQFTGLDVEQRRRGRPRELDAGDGEELRETNRTSRLSAYALMHYDADDGHAGHHAHQRARTPTRNSGRPRPDLLSDGADRHAFRRRDRIRRHGAPALRRRRQRPAAGVRQRRSPRPIASATARRATSAPTRSSSAATRSVTRCTNPLPAVGRHRSGDHRPDSPPRAAGVHDPGARHHHARLRARDRDEHAGRERRRHAALDRKLVHRLHDRRTGRRGHADAVASQGAEDEHQPLPAGRPGHRAGAAAVRLAGDRADRSASIRITSAATSSRR